MSIVRVKDKEERIWNTYKINGIRDAIKRAEYEAHDYLKSKAGKLWLEEKAYEKAEEMMQEKGADGAVGWRVRAADKKKKVIIRRFDRMKAKILKVCVNEFFSYV